MIACWPAKVDFISILARIVYLVILFYLFFFVCLFHNQSSCLIVLNYTTTYSTQLARLSYQTCHDFDSYRYKTSHCIISFLGVFTESSRTRADRPLIQVVSKASLEQTWFLSVYECFTLLFLLVFSLLFRLCFLFLFVCLNPCLVAWLVRRMEPRDLHDARVIVVANYC